MLHQCSQHLHESSVRDIYPKIPVVGRVRQEQHRNMDRQLPRGEARLDECGPMLPERSQSLWASRATDNSRQLLGGKARSDECGPMLPERSQSLCAVIATGNLRQLLGVKASLDKWGSKLPACIESSMAAA